MPLRVAEEGVRSVCAAVTAALMGRISLWRGPDGSRETNFQASHFRKDKSWTTVDLPDRDSGRRDGSWQRHGMGEMRVHRTDPPEVTRLGMRE